jgi:hypothetical protein
MRRGSGKNIKNHLGMLFALCAFEKIELCAGEEREVALRIPRDALTQVDAQMCERYVEGRFDWFVRDGGADHLHGSACL